VKTVFNGKIMENLWFPVRRKSQTKRTKSLDFPKCQIYAQMTLLIPKSSDDFLNEMPNFRRVPSAIFDYHSGIPINIPIVW
jgi:hypothetical protein